METMNYQTLGERLRAAREQAHLSQTEAAAFLDLTSAALSQYETGKRRVDALALERLAHLYAVPLAFFFEGGGARTDWEAALYARAEDLSVEGRAGVGQLTSQVRQFQTLYDLAGAEPPGRPHHAFRPLPERAFPLDQVELYAEDARRHFDLGSAPLRDVKSFLEALGAHVFGIELGEGQADLSGLFFMHPELGAIVAVNSDQHYGRRSFTLAHELAHVLFHYDRPAILCRSDERHPSEQFADRFAARFLVPRRALFERMRELGLEKARRAEDVVHLARYFGVSYLAMYYRLKGERRLDASIEDPAAVRPVVLARQLGYAPSEHEYRSLPWSLEDRLPQVFIELAYRAWQNGDISPRRAAEMLGISHLEFEDRLNLEIEEQEDAAAYYGY